MTPGRQAKMRTNGSRPGKAQRIVPDLERKCCNRTDTGNGHQSTANLIVLNHLQRHQVQFGVAIEDRPAHVQHRLLIMVEKTKSVRSISSRTRASYWPRLTAPTNNP